MYIRYNKAYRNIIVHMGRINPGYAIKSAGGMVSVNGWSVLPGVPGR